MTTAVSNHGSPPQTSPRAEPHTPLPTVTDALRSHFAAHAESDADPSAARAKLRAIEALIEQINRFLADPNRSDAEKTALMAELFGAGHGLPASYHELTRATAGSPVGVGLEVIDQFTPLAAKEVVSGTHLRGASLQELGRIIQLIAQGDAAALARALSESRAPGDTFGYGQLSLTELQRLAAKLSARLGGPSQASPSGHWRDMAQVYSSSEFLTRDPQTKRRGTFEFSPAAEAVWAAKIENKPELRAVYQRLKDALRLANSMLSMIEHDHYALAFALKFFGDTESGFDEDSEDLGYLGMGRTLLAMSSSDPEAIYAAIDAINVAEANEMYRSFDKELSEWRSKNEIRPIEDQAGRELLDGLETAGRKKREAAGITEGMTLAEQQRRLDAEMERSRASMLAAQKA